MLAIVLQTQSASEREKSDLVPFLQLPCTTLKVLFGEFVPLFVEHSAVPCLTCVAMLAAYHSSRFGHVQEDPPLLVLNQYI